MKSDVCELYKLLHNPLRLKMLRRIYTSRDGMNVGLLVDEMTNDGAKQSCVSQYLKQLEKACVIVRRRAGRYVNYLADASLASANVRKVVKIVIRAEKRLHGQDLTVLFGVLMNPFRAAAVCELASRGTMNAATICAKFSHPTKCLKRDMQAAVDAGIVAKDDSDDPTYRFLPPTGESVVALIALCV